MPNGLPKWADSLAKIPSEIGGFGFFDPATSGPAAFVVPLARSIRFALFGITLRHTCHELPPSLCHLYTEWETSDLPLFRAYRHHARVLAPNLPRNKKAKETDPLRYLTLEHPIGNMAR